MTHDARVQSAFSDVASNDSWVRPSPYLVGGRQAQIWWGGGAGAGAGAGGYTQYLAGPTSRLSDTPTTPSPTYRTVLMSPVISGSAAHTPCVYSAAHQGLTLVHFSAQREHFLLDKGCILGLFRGCLGGVGEYLGVYRVHFV